MGVEEGAEVVLFERERPAESAKRRSDWEWEWGVGGCVGDRRGGTQMEERQN